MEVDNPWMIFFLIMIIISMICTTCVLIHLRLHKAKVDLKYILLVLLHSTLLLEDFSTLPYLWITDSTLCEIMGWLHYYSGFANIVSVTLLGFHYLSYILTTFPEKINRWIRDYGVYFTLSFPLITLLPFSTESYGPSHGSWCSLPTNDDISNHWAIGIFYFWVLFCLCINWIQLSIAAWKVCKQELEQIRKSVFSSIGLYVIITFVCWIPRAVPRVLHVSTNFHSSDLFYMLTTLPIYLSGIGCAIVYYMDVSVNPLARPESASFRTEGSSIDPQNLAELFGVSNTVSENPINAATRLTVTGDVLPPNIRSSLNQDPDLDNL